MGAFHIWNDEKPPRDTDVLAKYMLSDDWHIVRTCKRGCCVSDEFGTKILPRYWKEFPAPPAGDEK